MIDDSSLWQWVIVDSIVYDLSKFAEIHPGGISVLLDADVGAYPLPFLSALHIR